MANMNYKYVYFYPERNKPFCALIIKSGKAVLSRYFKSEQEAVECVARFKRVGINYLLRGDDGMSLGEMQHFLNPQGEPSKPLPPGRPRVLRVGNRKPVSTNEHGWSGKNLKSGTYEQPDVGYADYSDHSRK